MVYVRKYVIKESLLSLNSLAPQLFNFHVSGFHGRLFVLVNKIYEDFLLFKSGIPAVSDCNKLMLIKNAQ